MGTYLAYSSCQDLAWSMYICSSRRRWSLKSVQLSIKNRLHCIDISKTQKLTIWADASLHLFQLKNSMDTLFICFRSTAGLEVVPTLEKLYMSNNELQVTANQTLLKPLIIGTTNRRMKIGLMVCNGHVHTINYTS